MSLEEEAVRALAERGCDITTAESCTGGLVAAALISVAGASAVYKEGYITYSNEAKRKLLGVEEEILLKYGGGGGQGRRRSSRPFSYRNCGARRRDSGKTGRACVYRLLSEWGDKSGEKPFSGFPA